VLLSWNMKALISSESLLRIVPIAKASHFRRLESSAKIEFRCVNRDTGAVGERMWETGRSVSCCNMLTNPTGEVNFEKQFSSYILIPQTLRNAKLYNKLFRRPRHWSLFWAIQIHSKPIHPIYLCQISIYSVLYVCLNCGLCLQIFAPTKIMHAHVVSAMNWNITPSYHSAGFYYLNNVRLGGSHRSKFKV